MQASGQIQGLAAQNRMMGSNVRIAAAMQVEETSNKAKEIIFAAFLVLSEQQRLQQE